ncbi:FG-GAP repeat protein [Streptomyces sp. M19]
MRGDVDGDGYNDLVIAANQEAIGDVERAGSVTVVFGGKDGLSSDAIAFHAPKATEGGYFGDQLAVGTTTTTAVTTSPSPTAATSRSSTAPRTCGPPRPRR